MLPIVEQLLRNPPQPGSGVAALLLSPTRELAQQIADAADTLLAETPLSVRASRAESGDSANGADGSQALSVVGGTNVNTDAKKLSGRNHAILIATPGRLQDLIDHFDLAAHFSSLRFFVLDECDRLLDQGFAPAVLRIMSSLPDRQKVPRQSLLFSATVCVVGILVG